MDGINVNLDLTKIPIELSNFNCNLVKLNPNIIVSDLHILEHNMGGCLGNMIELLSF